MNRKRRILAPLLGVFALMTLLAVPGCTMETDIATFLQDFAREALAAFLL